MPSRRSSIFHSTVIFTTATFFSIIAIFLLAHLSDLPQFTIWPFKITSVSPSYLPGIMGDNPSGSCPTNAPLSTTKRTAFGRFPGCTVYGYPSSGGILIKEADIVDMQFLSLDRFQPSQRSPNVGEEDKFCTLMRRLGATWWASEQEWIDVELGVRERTELEKRVLVFGWPSDGVGLWVLRFASEREVPRDFGRVGMAVSMDERIKVMKEYEAVFYEDTDEVNELAKIL